MRASGRWLLAAFAWFGLAHGSAADPLFAEVTLNGAPTGELVQFERKPEGLSASVADLRRIGLALPQLDAGDTIDLSERGLAYDIDGPTQVVRLTVPAAALSANRMAEPGATFQPPDRAAWGVVVDYSAYVVSDKARRLNASAAAEVRAFGPYGVISSSFLAHSAAPPRGKGLQRLETTFVREDAEGARRLTVGDFISASLPWTTAVRAGGISLTTDFSLRPDLLTQPVPQVRGVAAAPSTVELYVNGVRRYASQTGAGPFSVDMAPTMDGQGQVNVVVTDSLGRQSVQTLPFYAASDLLVPKMTAYAVQAGWLRQGYASPDDRYADAFATAVVRRGLTERLTFEAHATMAGGVRTLGAGLVAKVEEAALFSVAFNGSDGPEGAGGKIHLSARRQTARYSLFATFEQATPGFREQSWRFGDGETRQAVQLGASLRTERWGAVAASYNRIQTRRETFTVAGVNWSREFGPVNVYANVLTARESRSSVAFTIGLTAPLRRDRSFSAAAASSHGRTRLATQVSSPAPAPYGWAWRVASEGGGGPADLDRLEAEVRRTSDMGELGLGVARQGSRTYVRGFGAGSLVLIGGKVRPAAQVGQGFALIETGEPDVALTLENRPIGRTGKDGALLAVQLPPGAASRVAIDPDSVPLSRDIKVQTLLLRPPRGAGVVARLPVQPVRAAIFQFVDPQRRPIPPGAQILLNGREAGQVGFDGEAYLTDLQPKNTINISNNSGECRLEATYVPPREDAAARVGPLVCALEAPRDPFGSAARYANHGGGGELRGGDRRDDLSELPQRDRPPDGLEQRLRGDAVHLQRSRLRRLWIHYRNPVRWFGRRR